MEPQQNPAAMGRRPIPGRMIVSREAEGSERVAPHVEGLDEGARNAIYEAAKHADHEIGKLQALAMPELIEVARREGLEDIVGLNRQELLFQLLRRRATSTGLGWAEGVLDILPDGFGFLRSKNYNYVPGPDDIYVSPSQIRRLNLKQGHLLAGPVRPPKEGEKYFALLHVEAVNSRTIDEQRHRIPFENLTPVHPHVRLQLEQPGGDVLLRLLDLLAPLGKGQRALLHSPPGARRVRNLVRVAQALLANHPDLHLTLLLLDARPEEVTEAQRGLLPHAHREILAATFEEPPNRQVALAQMTVERLRRCVEAGQDVVLLADSLTALARACHVDLPHSGKLLAPGLDAVALQLPKRLFGSARSVAEGGSLTILATILTGTGSRTNDAIVEEFAGKANCEIVFDRHLAELHVDPALDVARTGTRSEDNLLPPDALAVVRKLRRQCDAGDPAATLERLLALLAQHPDNDRLLASDG
jgi:transcription termination factor Rho